MGEGAMTEAAPLYSNQHLLAYDWGVVTSAWLQKFPDPDLKQVSSVETVARVIDESAQTMHVRRLFQCTFHVPPVVERLLGKKAQVVCVEEAHWDLGRRRLTVHGRNETLQNVVRIHEVCCFTEVGPGQTLYTQSATVMYRRGLLSGMLMPLVNELCAGICQRNAHKGITAMVARTEREAAFLRGDLPVDPLTADQVGGSSAAVTAAADQGAIAALKLPALGLLAAGLGAGFFAASLAPRWRER